MMPYAILSFQFAFGSAYALEITRRGIYNRRLGYPGCYIIFIKLYSIQTRFNFFSFLQCMTIVVQTGVFIPKQTKGVVAVQGGSCRFRRLDSRFQ